MANEQPNDWMDEGPATRGGQPLREYPLTQSCGHVQTYRSYGPIEGSEAAFLASRVCRECWVAAKEAAKDEVVKQAEGLAVGRHIPALEGTPKQVAWATQVRAAAIVAAESAFRSREGYPGNAGNLERFYAGIEVADAARWWLEHAAPGGRKGPDIGPREWLALMFGGDAFEANVEDRGGWDAGRAAEQAEVAKRVAPAGQVEDQLRGRHGAPPGEVGRREGGQGATGAPVGTSEPQAGYATPRAASASASRTPGASAAGCAVTSGPRARVPPGVQGGPQRSLPLRVREEVQEVLRSCGPMMVRTLRGTVTPRRAGSGQT